MLAAHVKPPKRLLDLQQRFDTRGCGNICKVVGGTRLPGEKSGLWYVTFTKNVGTIRSKCFTTQQEDQGKSLDEAYMLNLKISHYSTH